MKKDLEKYIEQLLEQIVQEMPIQNITRIGDFSRNSSIRNPMDRELLTNPRAEIKIRKIWNKTLGNFDLVFINDRRVNKPEFREIGIVDENFIREQMKISEEELKIDPSATTIIYTNNSGDERAMSSGWILAHRLGHAISATGRYNSNKSELTILWNEFVDQLTNLFRNIIKDVYEIPVGTRRFEQKDENILKLASMQLGTMKSARDFNMRSWYEFAYELFAQYLLFGKVILKPLPDSLIIKLKGFIKNKRFVKNKEIQDMYNKHDLEYYTGELESNLDSLISNLQGKIFVM